MMSTVMELKSQPHWSYSAFSCYLQCPMKYYFRYVEHAPAERTNVCLPFGRAFHAVLSERARKGSTFTEEDARESFSVYFKGETDASDNLTYKDGESFDSCLQKGFEMLEVAVGSWNDDFSVKSVAEAFSVSVPNLSRPLIGEFDLVVTDGCDEAVCDWKTSASKWPAGKVDYDLQATTFCYAYRQIHGKSPVFRFDVFTKAKTPQQFSYYTVRTQEELDRFEWLTCRLEHSIEDGLFYPNASMMNCSECPYSDRCRKIHRKER